MKRFFGAVLFWSTAWPLAAVAAFSALFDTLLEARAVERYGEWCIRLGKRFGYEW